MDDNISKEVSFENHGEIKSYAKDTIYRQDAIDVARKCRVIEVTPAHMLIDKAEVMTELMMLPSAQPNLDEWCRDCKEYDKERHSCPRWNRVIKHTVEDLKAEQPERKKGIWIDFPNLMAYKCSECGRIIQTTDGRRNVSRHYPFCHCGADMRGADNAD